ncbi:MAG: hypothetical protein P8Y40_13820, partial [Desulfobacterales bacterium]
LYQLADKSFRGNEGFLGQEEPVPAGSISHQLQPMFKIDVQLFVELVQMHIRCHELFNDEINGILFQHDVYVMVFEEIKFNLFDLIIVGAYLADRRSDVHGVTGITIRHGGDARGGHGQAEIFGQFASVRLEVVSDEGLLFATQLFEGSVPGITVFRSDHIGQRFIGFADDVIGDWKFPDDGRWQLFFKGSERLHRT